MTRAQAIEQFEEFCLPIIEEIEKNQSGGKDIPLRCEDWNNFTDHLCKEGLISDWQYENWSQPEHICD